MSKKNTIKFTAADIERYHKGLLSDKERHALEKAALDDPFLADALEGYAVAGVDAGTDISELRRRLAERTEEKKQMAIPGRKGFVFMRAAAIIILLAGAGWLVYQFTSGKNEKDIAQVSKESKPVNTDSNSNTVTAPAGTTTNQTDFNKPNTDTTLHNNASKGKETIITKNNENKDPGKKTETTIIKPGENNVTMIPVPVKTAGGKGAPVPSTIKTGEKDIKDEGRTEIAVAPKEQDKRDEVEDLKKSKAPVSRGADDLFRNQRTNIFRGRVTDNSNTGVPFANVTNVQDNAGTYTDANGNFTLTSSDSILNVQVHSIGFANNNVQLRPDASMNKVILQEDRKGLSEVVISNTKPNAAARNSNGNMVLDEPQPVDGWEKYDSYLANNLNIPESFKTQKPSNISSVEVSFEVNGSGEPVNIKVERSLCSACDKEAIRLIKEGPKWKRNAKKGRTTVTINF